MTRTLAQGRTRRAQILCVGLGNAVGELSTADMPPHIEVDSLFDAIGELTLSSARTPIDTILIAQPALDGATAESIEALRDIEPAARLILVRDAHAIHSPLSALFDHSVSAPLNFNSLSTALSGHPDDARMHDAAPLEQSTHDQAADDDAQHVDTSQESLRAKPESHHEHVAQPIEIEIQRPTVEPNPKRSTLADEPLGDVDLVEAILHQDGRLLELCMRLIMQQTGWTDVLFNDTNELMDGAVASVVYDGDAYGMLATESADARALKPWADWLARWLALDEAHHTHRLNSLRDDLTGAWNRRFFTNFLCESLKRARQLRVPVTVMVFDIDDFKIYNDQYGHDAGDEILIETVRLLESVIRQCDRVCRIGGDEFAVIFADLEGPRAAGSAHPDAVGDIAKRFQKQVTAMTFPKLSREAPGSLTISGGLATFPWDGDDPDVLLRLADQRALQSKRAGKNVITFGPASDES